MSSSLLSLWSSSSACLVVFAIASPSFAQDAVVEGNIERDVDKTQCASIVSTGTVGGSMLGNLRPGGSGLPFIVGVIMVSVVVASDQNSSRDASSTSATRAKASGRVTSSKMLSSEASEKVLWSALLVVWCSCAIWLVGGWYDWMSATDVSTSWITGDVSEGEGGSTSVSGASLGSLRLPTLVERRVVPWSPRGTSVTSDGFVGCWD